MEYLVWVGPRDSDIQFRNVLKRVFVIFLKKIRIQIEKHIYTEIVISNL